MAVIFRPFPALSGPVSQGSPVPGPLGRRPLRLHCKVGRRLPARSRPGHPRGPRQGGFSSARGHGQGRSPDGLGWGRSVCPLPRVPAPVCREAEDPGGGIGTPHGHHPGGPVLSPGQLRPDPAVVVAEPAGLGLHRGLPGPPHPGPAAGRGRDC